MTVYADIMFLINFILDFIIAYFTSKAAFIPISSLRLILGAVLGGMYGVFMFEEGLSFLYSPFFKIIFSVVLILISLNIKSLKDFLRVLSNYYIIAFSVCGTGIFISYFGLIKMREGFFTVDYNIFLLIPAAVLTCTSVAAVLKIINRDSLKKLNSTSVEIYMEDKSVNVTGMMDTGNLLLDPVSLYPVIVVDYKSVIKVIPNGLLDFFSSDCDLNSRIERKYINKIRLIPYNTVSSDDILKGFKPDLVIVKNKEENKILKDVIIAVTHKNLFKENEYSAILNPQI